MLNLKWTEFKTAIPGRNVGIQYVETSEFFHLFIFFGRLEISCNIEKNPIDPTDLNDWNTNYKQTANTAVASDSLPAFSAKKISINGVIKSLHARNTGKRYSVNSGANNLIYTATYPLVKIVGIECIGGEIGDYAELKVYDTPSGTYSGVPNYFLNQFGFELNIAKDFYSRTSPFDADLYAGMVLSISYESVSTKQVYLNYLMNEVK